MLKLSDTVDQILCVMKNAGFRNVSVTTEGGYQDVVLVSARGMQTFRVHRSEIIAAATPSAFVHLITRRAQPLLTKDAMPTEISEWWLAWYTKGL